MKFIANILANAGVVLHLRRRDDNAYALYQKAWDGGSDNISALAAFGLLMIRRGEFEKARDVLEKALIRTKNKRLSKKRRDLMSVRIPQNLGLAYWKLGEIDKAVFIYEENFKKFPNLRFYETLGFLLIEQAKKTGDFEKALRFNEKAMEYDENAVILDNMGQLYMLMGDAEKAEEFLRRALEMNPKQFDSLVCLAKCLLAKGEKDEAIRTLDLALEQKFSHLNTVSRDETEALRRELDAENAAGRELIKAD